MRLSLGLGLSLGLSPVRPGLSLGLSPVLGTIVTCIRVMGMQRSKDRWVRVRAGLGLGLGTWASREARPGGQGGA